MEYLPHNGNAFDSSVSELLNLRAAGASGAFGAPKKSASRRVMCLYVVSLSVPLVCAFFNLFYFLFFWCDRKASPSPQQLDSAISIVKL